MPRYSILLASLFFLGSPHLEAENWPEFRGPSGQGHYEGKNLPLQWSETKNVVWKQAIPGKGWSSPIVQDGKVYLTSAVPIEGTKNLSLQALCLDADKGTVLWQTEVFLQGPKAPSIHTKNSHASPTPITDGKHLFVHFGHQGSACLDLEGKVIWRNKDLAYAPANGNGGSMILVDDRLVFSADGKDTQFVYALDKADGKVVWKTNRKSVAPDKFCFSTPLLITVNGQRQIVSPGAGAVVAYDPADGKEIWRVKYGSGYSVIPRPVFGHGLVFIGTGYGTASLMAIRVDGKGDVTDSHVAWKLSKGAPHTPSPLLVGDELYAVSDKGIASCIDARTGKVHWQERVRGNYSASPLHCDGKIYFQSEEGDTTVVGADKEFTTLALSKVNERTFASYAVADGAIYLRTETQLYRIQNQKGEK